MFERFSQEVRRECSSGCWHVLQVDLVGYEVLSIVLGLGTLVSGSDDVP